MITMLMIDIAGTCSFAALPFQNSTFFLFLEKSALITVKLSHHVKICRR